MHFRQGVHHQHPKQMIIQVADTADKAKKFIGKEVTWTSEGQKKTKIVGKIVALHGRKGNVRAIFTEKGLPGQSIGKKIQVE